MGNIEIPAVEHMREKILYEIWKLVEQKYVLFHEKDVDWKDILDKYNQNLVNIHTYKELYHYIDAMLLELHDPHTRVFCSPYNNMKYVSPVFLKWINGKYYINECLTNGNLRKGMQVIGINNSSIAKIENLYINYYGFKAKNYTRTLLLKDFHNGKMGKSISLTVQKQKTIISENIDMLDIGDKVNFKLVNMDSISIKPYYSKIYEGEIGYLRLFSFFNSAIATEVEKEIKHMNSIRSLIIDIRENSGGLIECAKNLASFFICENVNIGYRTSRIEGGSYCDLSIPSPVYVQSKNLCKGIEKIVVLCNEFTMSSAEYIFLMALVNDKRKIWCIGNQTAGLAHGASIFTLFDGTRVQITTLRYLDKNKEIVQERGIIPDIEVNNNIEEITLGIDNQLNFAIEFCKNG